MDHTTSCDLCRLHEHREIRTKLHHEDAEFIVVDCMICETPMVVLKAHRASFSELEKTRLRKLLIQLFGVSGVIDFEQRKIPDHAHCHLRPRAFPGTVVDPLAQYV